MISLVYIFLFFVYQDVLLVYNLVASLFATLDVAEGPKWGKLILMTFYLQYSIYGIRLILSAYHLDCCTYYNYVLLIAYNTVFVFAARR